jgi:hypothetical protein
MTTCNLNVTKRGIAGNSNQAWQVQGVATRCADGQAADHGAP